MYIYILFFWQSWVFRICYDKKQKLHENQYAMVSRPVPWFEKL